MNVEPMRILECFEEVQIPHVIVGGMAMVLHGIPRATIDVDIVIPARREVVLSVIEAVEKAGLKVRNRDIVQLLDAAQVLIGQWLSCCDGEGRDLLDILIEEDRAFDALLKHAIALDEKEGTVYRIASLADIRRMKRESGRPVDLADVALIDERLRLEHEEDEDE